MNENNKPSDPKPDDKCADCGHNHIRDAYAHLIQFRQDICPTPSCSCPQFKPMQPKGDDEKCATLSPKSKDGLSVSNNALEDIKGTKDFLKLKCPHPDNKIECGKHAEDGYICICKACGDEIDSSNAKMNYKTLYDHYAIAHKLLGETIDDNGKLRQQLITLQSENKSLALKVEKLTYELSAIHGGIRNEFTKGELSDVVSDFGHFIEHHTDIEKRLEELTTSLAKEEKSHLQSVTERDEAQESISHAYYLITGRSPEWSNNFGFKQALEEIDECQTLLRCEIGRLTTSAVMMREALEHLKIGIQVIAEGDYNFGEEFNGDEAEYVAKQLLEQAGKALSLTPAEVTAEMERVKGMEDALRLWQVMHEHTRTCPECKHHRCGLGRENEMKLLQLKDQALKPKPTTTTTNKK